MGYRDGTWTPVSEATPCAVAIEWPGPDHDLPFFELLRVEKREDGRYDVTGLFMESDREWTAVFGGDDLLMVDER